MKTETRVGIFIITAIGILLFMSIHIGEFRLNKGSHYPYIAYFEDISGVVKKSAVKIAGVTVGWVESIELLKGGKAEIELRIHKRHKLARNAYARISQEGLIGTKSIEVDPSDSAHGILPPGSTLSMPGRTPANISNILEQFREFSVNINDVADSLRNAIASPAGEERLTKTVENIQGTSEKLSKFSETIEQTSGNIKEPVENIAKNLESTTDSLNEKVPGTMENINHAAENASDMFHHADQVVSKVNDGKGILGELLSEGDLHTDIKEAVRGVKDYIGRTEKIGLSFNSHYETMIATNERKGYVNVQLEPHEDYFYNLQIVSSTIGSVKEINTYQRFEDENGNVIDLPLNNRAENSYKVRTIQQDPIKPLFGFQIGKRFQNMSLRIGLFENTGGGALDIKLPTGSKNFEWTSSLEFFDFSGYNRSASKTGSLIREQRVHAKWINTVAFMRNIYTSFGLDDFMSRRDASPFFGAGIKFDDDDFKYLLSMLPIKF